MNAGVSQQWRALTTHCPVLTFGGLVTKHDKRGSTVWVLYMMALKAANRYFMEWQFTLSISATEQQEHIKPIQNFFLVITCPSLEINPRHGKWSLFCFLFFRPLCIHCLSKGWPKRLSLLSPSSALFLPLCCRSEPEIASLVWTRLCDRWVISGTKEVLNIRCCFTCMWSNN